MDKIIVMLLFLLPIVGYSQNVGIGKSNPQAKLEIKQTSNLNPTFMLSDSFGVFAGRLAFRSLLPIYSNRGWYTDYKVGVHSKNNEMFLYNDSTNVMNLYGTGNITIGDGVNPDARLSILSDNPSADVLNIMGSFYQPAFKILGNRNIGIGIANPLARLHVVDSNVIFTAPTVSSLPSSFTVPIEGAGTRMMWLPKKSAFRVGTVVNSVNNEGDFWNADSIGLWSFAAGYNTKAKGYNSTSFGAFSEAIGSYSTSTGLSTLAEGFASFSTGYVAYARGAYAMATGLYTLAAGTSSVAMGEYTSAQGYNSTAMGRNTFAKGSSSIAMGESTIASGNHSTSMNCFTKAKAYASLVIGRYNDSLGISSTTAWIPSDPLFQIGNGVSGLSLHNAMVVYKNGNMVLKNPSAVLSIPVSFSVPITGAGTRMMWLPEKSAFRVGTATGSEWNADSIGTWSIAAGRSTKAKGAGSVSLGFNGQATDDYAVVIGANSKSNGFGSVALGYRTNAIGDYSTSAGYETFAKGVNSTAIGDSAIATGATSFALGQNTFASGSRAIALGFATIASGFMSTAMGYKSLASSTFATASGDSTIASGIASFAAGKRTVASGHWSTAMGEFTQASGQDATALGESTIAKAYGSLSIGTYNNEIATSSQNAWVSSDPIFIIGNGIGPLNRTNAVVTYKNGNTEHNGFTRLGKVSEAAPIIKMKKLTVNTPNAQGLFNFVAHGLNESKILSISALVVVPGGYQLLPNHEQAGFKYTLNMDNANIAVGTVAGNSGNILDMPVKILITYEE